MSKQTEIWSTEFGKAYTDRNLMSLGGMEKLHEQFYGFSRTKINEQFIGHLDRNIKILEVGCNVGTQLVCLQKMGFVNLYGIELQSYAVELAKNNTKGINIIQGNALDIPFKSRFFDLVFTSGVLIHIGEQELPDVMREISRCSNCFIFGFEYYAEKRIEINYRGNSDLLWKDNYPKLYCDLLPLKIVRLKIFKYLESDNKDVAFLLRLGN